MPTRPRSPDRRPPDARPIDWSTRASRGLLGRFPRPLVRGLVLLLVLPLWFLTLAPRAVGGPLSLVWVSGTSMEPTLSTGDLSVLHRADRYEVGDVVGFTIPEGGTVIHRVLADTEDGYRFRGDNRDHDDPWILDEDAILGRQVLALPHAARVLTALGRPSVMAALVAAMVVLTRLRRDEEQASEDEADGGAGTAT